MNVRLAAVRTGSDGRARSNFWSLNSALGPSELDHPTPRLPQDFVLCVHLDRQRPRPPPSQLLPTHTSQSLPAPEPHIHHVPAVRRVESAPELPLLRPPASANTTLGAHRAHHRCLPCRHSLRISPFDSVPRILPQRAKAVPHPVSHTPTVPMTCPARPSMRNAWGFLVLCTLAKLG